MEQATAAEAPMLGPYTWKTVDDPPSFEPPPDRRGYLPPYEDVYVPSANPKLQRVRTLPHQTVVSQGSEVAAGLKGQFVVTATTGHDNKAVTMHRHPALFTNGPQEYASDQASAVFALLLSARSELFRPGNDSSQRRVGAVLNGLKDLLEAEGVIAGGGGPKVVVHELGEYFVPTVSEVEQAIRFHEGVAADGGCLPWHCVDNERSAMVYLRAFAHVLQNPVKRVARYVAPILCREECFAGVLPAMSTFIGHGSAPTVFDPVTEKLSATCILQSELNRHRLAYAEDRGTLDLPITNRAMLEHVLEVLEGRRNADFPSLQHAVDLGWVLGRMTAIPVDAEKCPSVWHERLRLLSHEVLVGVGNAVCGTNPATSLVAMLGLGVVKSVPKESKEEREAALRGRLTQWCIVWGHALPAAILDTLRNPPGGPDGAETLVETFIKVLKAPGPDTFSAAASTWPQLVKFLKTTLQPKTDLRTDVVAVFHLRAAAMVIALEAARQAIARKEEPRIEQQHKQLNAGLVRLCGMAREAGFQFCAANLGRFLSKLRLQFRLGMNTVKRKANKVNDKARAKGFAGTKLGKSFAEYLRVRLGATGIVVSPGTTLEDLEFQVTRVLIPSAQNDLRKMLIRILDEETMPYRDLNRCAKQVAAGQVTPAKLKQFVHTFKWSRAWGAFPFYSSALGVFADHLADSLERARGIGEKQYEDAKQDMSEEAQRYLEAVSPHVFRQFK